MKRILMVAAMLLGLSGLAHATSQTVFLSTQAPSSYATVPSSITWVAADVSNGNAFASTGAELLLVWNSDTVAHVFTVTSVADSQGRAGDSTKNINGGSYYVLQVFPASGWRQTDGNIYLTAADATIKFAVIRIPNIRVQ